jgi:hypothetical protein
MFSADDSNTHKINNELPSRWAPIICTNYAPESAARNDFPSRWTSNTWTNCAAESAARNFTVGKVNEA